MLEIYKFEVFTAPCEIKLYIDDKNIADICAKEILNEAKTLESKYNYFDSSSYLFKLNSRQINSLDTQTINLLKKAKLYYKKTAGVFDITLATIKDIYLENKNINELEKQKENLKQYIGCEHFNIKKSKLYFTNAFTKIDLGGLIKEYAVDRAVNTIKKYKIKSALINFGGDIYVLGKKPNGQKFNIAITNPKDKEKVLFNIELENKALTTSASYERNIQIEDKTYSHILTKDDMSEDILSVSIVSDSCLNSGVYSTALMVNNKLKIDEEKYLINKDLEVIR